MTDDQENEIGEWAETKHLKNVIKELGLENAVVTKIAHEQKIGDISTKVEVEFK